MRAALYARFSTDYQSSTADQLRVCEEIAARQGFTIVARYNDEAISGGTADRPGYNAMLAAVRAGQFDVIVAEDASRLWRNLAEQAPRVAELLDLGLHVVTIDFDPRHEAADIIGAFTGAMNSRARREIGRRVRRTHEGKARKGQPTGGRAYGYTSTREIVPEQASIVREIFRRYAAGDSMMSIAHELNARGEPSPGADWGRKTRRRDKVWVISALHAMLKNELYIGRVIWNRSTWVRSHQDSKRRKRVLNPPDKWIVHDRPELRLIDDATWERAQRRMSERREMYKPGAGGRAQYLLSGLLRCGVCGAAYVISAHRPIRYACSTYRHGGPAGCENRLALRRDVAETMILKPVMERLLSRETIDHVVRYMREAAANEAQPTENTEIERIDRELEELQRLVERGLLSPLAVTGARRELQDRRRTLQRTAERANVQTVLFGAEKEFRETVEEMRTILTGDDVLAGREALRELLGEVPLTPEGDTLVTELYARPLALVAAGGVNWNGSGGRI